MFDNWNRKFILSGLIQALICGAALANQFNIAGGSLKDVLNIYSAQAGVPLLVSTDAVRGIRSSGAKGDLSNDTALTRILMGTGFVAEQRAGGVIAVVRDGRSGNAVEDSASYHVAAASTPAASSAALETVTVTSSKIGGDVQNIPISITALSQEQLTATQTAGGPDLIKQVPNMTFTKTNFSGYSIQLRGIGTQAISVTTDPAVAVAFNDIPFIRNHFFEQEFYDVANVEVLRGPQGTLYGRNATAGVVNLTSAKPTDQFEAMASIDIGNYGERRPEGMINIPIVDDRLDIRVAGEWTKRQGYSFNEITDQRIDGRDLWSGRVTLGWKPYAQLQTYLIWEHFSEDDDRLRSGKQLCKNSPSLYPDGTPVPDFGGDFNGAFYIGNFLSQGCLPTSLYGPDAFEVPNGFSIPYITAARFSGNLNPSLDPYADTVQSRNLRVIESTVNPIYRAKNDTVEFNADYVVTPNLTFTSQTGYNHDALYSAEDYNRFNTSPNIFGDGVVFCDPQVGCANRVVAEDLSDEHAWQLNQEFRLVSNFSGPLNFSIGANYSNYETEENYYVFANTLTLFTLGSTGATPFVSGVPYTGDNHFCLFFYGYGYIPLDPRSFTSGVGVNQCNYIDPNPISKLNNEGHNYFLSQNPYTLNSYAAFGEVYYNVLSDLKLVTGLRFTDDRKHFTDIPSEVLVSGWGYATTGVVNQTYDQFTGRFAANWTPKLDFTDQTLVYASYSHGYKAGGANPPGAALIGNTTGNVIFPIHPLTFKPEFVDAFELGSKNTLLDGALTLNADVFYYNYENYQISEIVDRTSINLNFDAHLDGAEVEANWEPIPGLRFNFAGGYEHTELAKGSQSIDLMDRTAGMADWMVVKPYPTQASNCIFPRSVVDAILQSSGGGVSLAEACGYAYNLHYDPVTQLQYVLNPTSSGPDDSGSPLSIPAGYMGFNPVTAPNNGEGFDKNLSGNELPNAPPFTVSFGAQYTMPITPDWAGTLRSDYYWQDYSWARIFNDNPYDRLRGYTNVNLSLIFTNQNGWQVMLYDKNVFNTAAVTGDFLNSDDSGLTTNVFLTDPKLIGIRVTKNW